MAFSQETIDILEGLMTDVQEQLNIIGASMTYVNTMVSKNAAADNDSACMAIVTSAKSDALAAAQAIVGLLD